MLAKSDLTEPAESGVGSLHVSARLAGGTLDELRVRLARPPIARIFIGRPPQFVRGAVPRLYALCRTAQQVAADAALAKAADQPASAADERALWLEFLHEALWRLLLDWPQALGMARASEAFAGWRGERQGAEAVSATQRLVAGPLSEIGEKCLACLVDPDVPDPEFPELGPERWLACWQRDPGCRPPWRQPVSIAAAYWQRLATARLAAAALAAGDPCPLATAGGAGWGVAQVLTARGVLTHAVQVEGGLVKRYRVQAPTDDCFADAAPLARLVGVRRFAKREEARRLLEQAILALDPCLPHVVELQHA